MNEIEIWEIVHTKRNSGEYFHNIKMYLQSLGVKISLDRVEKVFNSSHPISIYNPLKDKVKDEINGEKSSSPISYLRLEVIYKLGGKCFRCGFSDIRALQIDHVNGGGTKEVRSLGAGRMYRNILDKISTGKPLKDYQILCANCNWIKRYENNEVHPR